MSYPFGDITVLDIHGNIESSNVFGLITCFNVVGSLNINIVEGNITEYSHNTISRTPEYGLLYNGHAILDSRGIAPIGYHIPTVDDWNALFIYIGGTSVAGQRLREIGTSHWYTGNTGIDMYGLSLYGGGIRDYRYGSFSSILYQGNYATSSYVNTSSITAISTSYNLSYVAIPNGYGRNIGLSVRCIKDDPLDWTIGDVAYDSIGNVYNTIKIGTQVWLVQNLATTHFLNGDRITEITSNSQWSTNTENNPYICAYNNTWSYVY